MGPYFILDILKEKRDEIKKEENKETWYIQRREDDHL